MRRLRPSAAEERWLAVQHRHRALRSPIVVTGVGGWRSARLLTRCLFFVLGAFAVGALASVLQLLQISAAALVTGLLLLAAAEWLIIGRRFHASGIEEALHVGGLVMIALWIALDLHPPSFIAAALLALALFLAGARLLNPLMVTLSAIAFSIAIVLLQRAPAAPWSITQVSGALSFCLATAFGALLAGACHYRRPCIDRTLDSLVIVMPLAAYAWATTARGPALFAPLSLVPLLIYAPSALLLGLRRRTHAPLIAAGLCALCIAHELRPVFGLELKWQLVFWGAFVLAIASWLEHRLRTPWRGITSAPAAHASKALDALQTLGTALATPAHAGSATDPRIHGGGGSFGGGGATGNF